MTRSQLPAEDLEDLYENAPCGYLSAGPDGRIVKVNQTFLTWTGYAVGDVLGKRLSDLLNVAGRIFYETHFAPLLRMQGYFNEVALDVTKADGERLPVLANASERRSDSGQLLFTRLTLFQATQRRRHERELSNALADEKRVSELREQFIAVLGHDLRNPLASVDAGIRLLLQEAPSERAVKILSLMRGSVIRMAGLIDNVLDFARSRLGGGLNIERDATEPLEPALHQVVEELRAGTPERVIETEYDITHPIPADRSRICQLLSNLVGNALTHGTPDEPVRVRAKSDGETFELVVTNAGEKIPEAALGRLFQPFVRGEVRRSQKGLGLGLYIASEIAKAHDGEITVASNDKETRFTFRMPI